jgi:hypothetical protein
MAVAAASLAARAVMRNALRQERLTAPRGRRDFAARGVSQAGKIDWSAMAGRLD